jgi:hypothetical protein
VAGASLRSGPLLWYGPRVERLPVPRCGRARREEWGYEPLAWPLEAHLVGARAGIRRGVCGGAREYESEQTLPLDLGPALEAGGLEEFAPLGKPEGLFRVGCCYHPSTLPIPPRSRAVFGCVFLGLGGRVIFRATDTVRRNISDISETLGAVLVFPPGIYRNYPDLLILAIIGLLSGVALNLLAAGRCPVHPRFPVNPSRCLRLARP